MNRSYGVPASYAVELFSLGKDMGDAGVDHLTCSVPCMDNDGLLIPTMEGESGKYSKFPFCITVESYDETGGGVVRLTPEATALHENPRVDLPIFKPDDLAPDILEKEISGRLGFIAIQGNFGVEVTRDELSGGEYCVGTVTMVGIEMDGSTKELIYEAGAAKFYMGLLRDVGVAKLPKLMAQRREEAAHRAATAQISAI